MSVTRSALLGGWQLESFDVGARRPFGEQPRGEERAAESVGARRPRAVRPPERSVERGDERAIDREGHDAGGVTRIPAVATSAFVDSTGAGDSFVAGALFGLLRGMDTAEAGRVAATVASFVVEAWGCQTNLPGEDQMRERYRAAFGDLRTP